MFDNVDKVLVLAPHTDDGEFGCGGTIAKLMEMGKDVHYVAFSDCEKSLPSDVDKNILVEELLQATEKLGIPPENVQVEKFEVRCFERDRQDILDVIIGHGRRINPDLVFLPSLNDLHQDHNTIAQEGIRAFKLSATILSYEMPWNNLSFNTTCFVKLSEQQIQKKIDALLCYKSQASRFYASEQFIKALAVTRGTQISSEYSETFEVVRWIIK